MKNSSNIQSAKSKTLGLLLAAMVPTGAALADGGYHRHDRGVEIGGEVVVTKQIPGGIVTVGATIGRPRPVVVEEKVVVVKERAPEKVVIIEREPVREKVVIVKERPVREKVVIVEQNGRHHRHTKKIIVHEDRGCRGRGHGHNSDNARQVSIQSQDGRGNSHYYRDGNQVSESYSGPEGNYHYYEDRNQVSIQDTRYGQNKHVYVRK